jgi:chromosome segregation ATPase
MPQQEMSFAQALNEAKSVIVQLSNRVKADADKIRTQQQTIVSQSSTITQHEARIREQDEQMARRDHEIADLDARIAEIEAVRAAAEQMINRQGERIGALEADNAALAQALTEYQAQITHITQERDTLLAQVPSEDDAAALASMAQLLAKAAPVIEKVKKSAGVTAAAATAMRIAPDAEPIAEAA